MKALQWAARSLAAALYTDPQRVVVQDVLRQMREHLRTLMTTP